MTEPEFQPIENFELSQFLPTPAGLVLLHPDGDAFGLVPVAGWVKARKTTADLNPRQLPVCVVGHQLQVCLNPEGLVCSRADIVQSLQIVEQAGFKDGRVRSPKFAFKPVKPQSKANNGRKRAPAASAS